MDQPETDKSLLQNKREMMHAIGQKADKALSDKRSVDLGIELLNVGNDIAINNQHANRPHRLSDVQMRFFCEALRASSSGSRTATPESPLASWVRGYEAGLQLAA